MNCACGATTQGWKPPATYDVAREGGLLHARHGRRGTFIRLVGCESKLDVESDAKTVISGNHGDGGRALPISPREYTSRHWQEKTKKVPSGQFGAFLDGELRAGEARVGVHRHAPAVERELGPGAGARLRHLAQLSVLCQWN